MAIILKQKPTDDRDITELYEQYKEQMDNGLMILDYHVEFVHESAETHELEIIEAEPIHEADTVTDNETELYVTEKRIAELLDENIKLRRDMRMLELRLGHLLQSDFIRSFDEVDINTMEYVRDIKYADQLVPHSSIAAVPIEKHRRWFGWL